MDRLSRVALVLAVVFIGSGAALAIGESIVQLWALFSLAVSGLALASVAVRRLFALLFRQATRSYLPIIIAVIAVATGCYLCGWQFSEFFESPRVAAGYGWHTSSFSSIVLREDGTAEHSSLFGASTAQRNVWLLSGDTIILLSSLAPQAPVKKRFLLSKTKLCEIATTDSSRRLWSFNLYLNKLTR